MTLCAAGPQEYVQQLASNLGELDNQNPSTQPTALENIKRLTHELVRILGSNQPTIGSIIAWLLIRLLIASSQTSMVTLMRR